LKPYVFNYFISNRFNSAEIRFAQDTGNKVARKATLVGTQNIMLGGKTVIQPEVMIRGDLIRSIQSTSSSASGAAPNNTAVSIGRYCFLSRGCCLRPPGRLYKGYRSTLSSHRTAEQVH
jgi:acetyltransferase-like isoleucine patch superfamily enzyme